MLHDKDRESKCQTKVSRIADHDAETSTSCPAQNKVIRGENRVIWLIIYAGNICAGGKDSMDQKFKGLLFDIDVVLEFQGKARLAPFSALYYQSSDILTRGISQLKRRAG